MDTLLSDNTKFPPLDGDPVKVTLQREKHRFWVRDVYKRRHEQGTFQNLVAEFAFTIVSSSGKLLCAFCIT